MIKEFVSYEIALALKELGFDEPCFTYYYNVSGKLRTSISIDIDDIWISGSIKKIGITLAPTLSQAFNFFSEKYGLDYVIIPYSEVIDNQLLRRFKAVAYRYYKYMDVQSIDVKINREIATFANKNQLKLIILQKFIQMTKNK